MDAGCWARRMRCWMLNMVLGAILDAGMDAPRIEKE